MTSPDDNQAIMRDLRLLLAVLDEDWQRALNVLDEEHLPPHVWEDKGNHALNMIEQMEAQHGEPQVRTNLQNAILKLYMQEEENRDLVGYTWWVMKSAKPPDLHKQGQGGG